MRSILQEESSVMKAIEKAWNKAGRPSEFSVKIFNVGKRGFLGFVKRAAIISFSYDLSREFKEVEHRRKVDRDSFKNREFGRNEKYEQQQERSYQATTGFYGKWTSDLIKDVNNWMSELVDIMGMKVNFSISVNNHLLKIVFDGPVISEVEDERLLFSSFVYMLMQFLKRKYKKKFRGHRLAITSNRE